MAIVGNVERMAQLWAQGNVDVNAPNSGGRTALTMAARTNELLAVRWLIADAHADINATDCEGCTAFWNACAWGSDDLVRYLLDAGANKDKANNDGWSPIARATLEGRCGAVQTLLDVQANVNTDRHPAYQVALEQLTGETQRHMLAMLAPHVNKISWNLYTSLLVALLGFLINFFQLLSLPFSVNIKWTVSFKVAIDLSSLLLFNLGDFGVSTTALMWATVGLVTPLLVLVTLSMSGLCSRFGTFNPDKRRWGTRLLDIYGFIVAVLFFIPIVRQLYGVYDCTRGDDGTLTLDASNDRETCYTGSHIFLVVVTPIDLLCLFYWSFRLLGTNGWYRGVYYIYEIGDSHSWFGRIFNWGRDKAVIFAYEWHLFTQSQWLPAWVGRVNKTLELTQLAVIIFATKYARAQLYASLVLVALSVLLVMVYPHQYWRRSMSLVYGASKYVLLATWTLAAAVHEDFLANETQYTQTRPGGDKGPTFITNGLVQLWHYLLLDVAAFVLGLGVQTLAMRWRPDPPDTAAFIKKQAIQKEFQEHRNAVEKARKSTRRRGPPTRRLRGRATPTTWTQSMRSTSRRALSSQRSRAARRGARVASVAGCRNLSCRCRAAAVVAAAAVALTALPHPRRRPAAGPSATAAQSKCTAR